MITAYYKEDDAYSVVEKEKYIGSFSKTSLFSATIRFWNNRYGSSNESDIEDATLVIEFPTVEEAKLLQYMKVTVDTIYEKSINITDTRGYVLLNRILSGQKNKGTEDYNNNYVDITITLTKDVEVQKVLKRMYLNVI